MPNSPHSHSPKATKITSSIGEKIKHQLRMRHCTTAEFTLQCGLPRFTLDNIIYGKSRNMRTLQIIADHLEVSLHYLLEDSPSDPISVEKPGLMPANTGQHPFQSTAYSRAIARIIQLQQKWGLILSKEQLDALAYDSYLYQIEHQASEKTCQAFAEGMIHQGLKYGILHKKTPF